MKKRLMLLILLFFTILTGCGSEESQADGKVELTFFSDKSENIDILQEIVNDFEDEYPDISIDLQSPPEAQTVLRTQLVRDNIPDVMALGGNAVFGEFAEGDVFADVTDEEFMKDIQPVYLDMLRLLVDENSTRDFGIPYVTNANGVVYNKKIFNKLNLEIPETWSEFIEILETAKKEGIKPIEFTLNDAWTALSIWNPIGGILVDDDFHIQKEEGTASFQEDYREVSKKMLELLDYGEGDIFGTDYDTGNANFVNNDALFYFQGNWAIPDMLTNDSDADLGFFALPASEDVSENQLVSGVDVLLSIGRDTDHKKEALLFVEYLMRPEVNQKYIDDQFAFSSIDGVLQENEIFEDVQPYFDEERLTSFPDHFYPIGFSPENTIQDFLINKNTDDFLKKMDSEW
ncbi:putative sugar ABC transporter sugar-binding protein [Tetragenococcus halophilus subsp. halophilus]|uniref:Sugar ABC transporter sugar-binding protein n=3 Tax=Tetragenococcus halophilus TaxID=51669 RepID=A0AAN1SGF1_TETHN|nr:ABC transporter substrate-binding protein [Tetragenococcus halophilus]AYW50278.1 carbohydrate ABC transporter substrate-binding protein [Tetragenococcus halophilus]BAK94553.1 putative sugar ABC transporter sugar-binding protein [Tetragenococcus halophilus NBRC 12172]GBD61662.1 putative sugar ABC transporter sugar-binding protein [Tetragenococcus halophilus subsp. halophilus]GBD63481.1 putative sugar ABC transporter sugar-binding protein [Tetragenococcus halophilus subsp. flandriensis]GBD706